MTELLKLVSECSIRLFLSYNDILKFFFKFLIFYLNSLVYNMVILRFI